MLYTILDYFVPRKDFATVLYYDKKKKKYNVLKSLSKLKTLKKVAPKNNEINPFYVVLYSFDFL